MDLEEFDGLDKIARNPTWSKTTNLDPGSILKEADEKWYIKASRAARWMDLLGDYAGSEPFIIDGESLLQIVLDDPLLAIGREDECSFQILHAYHSLERLLAEFVQRSANFDIVFWSVNRHLTLKTGDSQFIVSSRSLARVLLFNHLLKLDIPVHSFNDLDDPLWKRYEAIKKPMFVMMNDGGLCKDRRPFAAQIILCQRIFLFKLLNRGSAVTLLKGAEYRDSKIMSFVYEPRWNIHVDDVFPEDSFLKAQTSLNDRLSRQAGCKHALLFVPDQDSVPTSTTEVVNQISQRLLKELRRSVRPELLYLFIVHCLLLPSLSVRERARSLEALPLEITSILSQKLLPTFFFDAAQFLSSSHAAFDFDGRVFISMIRFLLSNHSVNVEDLIGQALYRDSQRIWQGLGLPLPNFSRFALLFQIPVLVAEPASVRPHIRIQRLEEQKGEGGEHDQTQGQQKIDQDQRKQDQEEDRMEEIEQKGEWSWEDDDDDEVNEKEEGQQVKDVTEEEEVGYFHLLPFSNPVFDEELSLVRVPVKASVEPDPLGYSDFGQGVLFSDTQHWHNQKAILPSHLGGETPKPVDERMKRRHLRSEQRFMNSLQSQAATIMGAAGKTLQQIVIPVVGTRVSSVGHLQNMKEQRGSKKDKAPKLSSKDKLLQSIKQKKETIQDDSSQTWWKEKLASLSGMTLSERIEVTKALFRNKRMDEGALALEFRLYRLNLELNKWIEEPKRESPAIRDLYTVSVMRMVKDIADRNAITATAAKILSSVLTALGFDKLVSRLSRETDGLQDRPLSFPFVKLVKSKTNTPYYNFMSITEHPIVWQLRLFGEFMDRSMDSQPDTRVSFDPDGWQRQVLDSIDNGHSLLVVAPTSAGKTFISYYAMEKVLRESDDGILVYVAPTKALVTQIAAEVYARFSKSLVGKSCWAVHTRDYRIHDPLKCQILVTVPEVLAIMLLSPPLARVWTPRIKRIVLDEIHSIGQQQGGAVWEQILLLAPCPIIGLSATIGSPETFNAWLQSVQEAHGFEHAFIEHPHRYSHLRKFYYAITSGERFTSLDDHQATSRSRFLHPISMLFPGIRSLPNDLSLEAKDTLSLFYALRAIESNIIEEDLQHLDPVSYFRATQGLLRQADILNYESELKQLLAKLIASSDPRDEISPLTSVIRTLRDPVIAQMSLQELNSTPSRTNFKESLIVLLADLHVKEELPAILFNFDRSGCEHLAQILIETLERAESDWRRESPEWKQKIKRWEAWKHQAKDRERTAKRLMKQKKPDGEDHLDVPTPSWESSFDPSDPSQAFSFTSVHTSYSKAELARDIRKISFANIPEWAISALKRGIGVHHAGMNKHYRSLVEGLFRLGFIRVIIATGTLALGINAPTRTSVFCGDSPYLTALMYRQCAGRAGRRGYDLLGNVVFYGLPMDRIQRLILSKLPSLGGTFPLTSTMILRLFNLLEGSKYAPVAVKAIKSMLSLPRIGFGSDLGRHQLLHHLRFSIEYLRRSYLVNETGKPMNLFAVAAHLYYTEPSNLALVTLLRHGALHKISRLPSFDLAKREFVLLMCHLFGRRYLSPVFANRRHLQELTRRYPSMVILPPISDHARAILHRHDEEILRIFTGYALAYAEEHEAQIGPGTRLPLSNVDYSRCADASSSQVIKYLQSTANHVVARSIFVATSGHCDLFGSINELTQTARQGLHLHNHAIPSMEHLITQVDEDNSSQHDLNAYLFDFYIHGQVKTLETANGIRRGDIWYLLQDFTLTLATVKAALQQLLLKTSSEVASQRDDLEEGGETHAVDPDEGDTDEDDGEESDFVRPSAISSTDWKVYEVVRDVYKEFNEKFRDM